MHYIVEKLKIDLNKRKRKTCASSSVEIKIHKHKQFEFKGLKSQFLTSSVYDLKQVIQTSLNLGLDVTALTYVSSPDCVEDKMRAWI